MTEVDSRLPTLVSIDLLSCCADVSVRKNMNTGMMRSGGYSRTLLKLLFLPGPQKVYVFLFI